MVSLTEKYQFLYTFHNAIHKAQFITPWTFNTKVILLTAIESLREMKKKIEKTNNKRKEDKAERTGISKGSTLDVASVETAADAWPDHCDVKSGYQWISGLKVLGR